MLKLFKIISVALCALVLFIAVGGAGLWLYARSTSTQWTGNQTITTAPAPVRITRDQWGVPHIDGDSDDAVYFGLGYVHAQDRMFQLELLRHVAKGTLAEIGGAPLAPIDGYIRTIGLYRAAQAAQAHLKPETIAVIEQYVAGINAVINNAPRPLAPELALLMHNPAPWTVADTIAINKLFAVGLSGDAMGEALSARLHGVLDDRQLQQIRLTYPEDGPVVYSESAPKEQQAKIAAAVMQGLPFALPKGASNNWVVDGRWTKSGKPLLANDPHLGIWAPSVFYLAHMKMSGGNAIGATAPGMPFIVMGRNDDIAWGFTNARGDVQDLFIETVDPSDSNKYMTPNGPQAFGVRSETINVRFGKPQTITIRETRHGPVLPMAMSGGLGFDDKLVSLSWTALHEDDTTLDAGLAITGATTVPELFEALKRFVVPQQNIVMADTSGNIGYLAPGRLPIRQVPKDGWGPLGPGRMPMNGADGSGDWVGMIPFAGLPQTQNPKSGYVVTANNQNVPDDHPYFIASDWETPYRAIRIEEMILAGNSYTLQDFVDMQQDALTVDGRTLLPHLLRETKASDDQAAEALRLLTAWDYVMDRNQIAPLIYKEWVRQISVHLYADEIGDLMDGADRHDTEFLVTVFGAGPNDAQARSWCNNINTEAAESCGDIASNALDSALTYLAGRFGDDMDAWRWGEAHYALHQHQPFGMVPWLKSVFDRTIPADGGPYTVYRANTDLTDKMAHTMLHGAAYRAVYDLADMNKSVYVVNTGQSGNPFSPYYDNLVKPWRDGALIPMWTDPALYEQDAIGTLTITP